MIRAALLVSAITLAGCTASPNTVTELKSTGYKESFSVDQNYQKTYRNIMQGFNACGGTESTWLKPGAVQSNLYTDIGQGHITVNLVPTIGSQKPLTHIQINNQPEGKSEVSIFYRWKDSVNKSGTLYRKWAFGDFVCK